MKKGLFITFEGIDGCGKTTQLHKVKEYLENSGYDVVVTREPGALNIGQKIRNILLHAEETVSDGCEMFLFLADRAQHVETFIKPALEKGKIVLCDRHTDSTIAYQGYGRGQDIELLRNLNNIAVNGLFPDLTFLYDISADIAQKRVGNEKDRMESSSADFYNRVRNGYLELQKQNTSVIKKIDANNSVEEVYSYTKAEVDKLLQRI